MSNENQKNHVTASTLLNAAALAQGILNEVLGNDASTMINGVVMNKIFDNGILPN